jgi:YaiO family outer membrane protein
MFRRFVLVSAIATMAPVASAQEPTEGRLVTPQWFAGASYGVQSFTSDIAAWQLGSVSLSHRDSRGTFIVRGNYARRFSRDGVQGEIDAYPRLSKRVYAYLNIGYSKDAVFPEWRSGAELFTSLPDAYEASLGYRQLRFAGSPVTLFTGALGKYVGNYWFSLRPYVASKTSGTSASANMQARRYYEDADHYVGARIGFGSTPTDQLVPDQAVVRTNAFTAAIQGSTPLSSSVLGTWSAGFEHERLSASSTRRSVAAEAGLRVAF